MNVNNKKQSFFAKLVLIVTAFAMLIACVESTSDSDILNENANDNNDILALKGVEPEQASELQANKADDPSNSDNNLEEASRGIQSNDFNDTTSNIDARIAKSEAEIEIRQKSREGKPVTFADDVSIMQAELANFYTYKSDRGTILILHDLSFAPQSSALSDRGRKALKSVAFLLLKHPLRQVAIEGHTDSQGDFEVNKKLSLDRAHAVRDALVAAGVNVRRMPVKGYGAEYPTHSNDTYAGRQRNRRVEIVISNSLGAVPKRD